MEPLQDRERVEFVPWDQLRKSPPARPSSRALMAGGFVVVALLGLGYTLARSSPASGIGAPSTSTSPISRIDEPVVVEDAPHVEADLGYSEADLRAADPGVDLAWVSGTASGFVRDYFSTARQQIHPYGSGEVPLYVEWVEVIGIEADESDGPWRVKVQVGLVEMGTEPRRLPASDFTVTVDRLGPYEATVGLPVLSPQPVNATVETHELGGVPEPVRQMALDRGVEGTIMGGWRQSDIWSVVVQQPTGPPVVVEVTDVAG